MKNSISAPIALVVCQLMAPLIATASEMPSTDNGCALTVQVERVIEIEVANSSLPNRVVFTVNATDCVWLKVGQRHESSSINADDRTTLKAISPGVVLTGKAAQGFTMGPNGVVRWTLFRSGKKEFWFTFS